MINLKDRQKIMLMGLVPILIILSYNMLSSVVIMETMKNKMHLDAMKQGYSQVRDHRGNRTWVKSEMIPLLKEKYEITR